nr:universal stress protein [uncultured Acidovorax sp.]
MSHEDTSRAPPTPHQDRRDSIGRRVAVSWHGAGAVVSAPGSRWLVAVDGSDCSLQAVAMLARLLAPAAGAGVDVVHVQSWLSKEAAETELERRGWSALTQARLLLDAAALPWRLHAVMGDAATEITGLADALDSRGIAIGSHGRTAAESVLLGSVAQQVIHRARRPVLVVR